MNIERFHEFKRIYHIDLFLNEFEKLFAKSGQYNRYKEKLYNRLGVLDAKGLKAIDGMSFEKIKDNLFAIRDRGSLNPRTLFAYFEDDNIFILTIFLEKSKSDYKAAILNAENRIEFIRRERYEKK